MFEKEVIFKEDIECVVLVLFSAFYVIKVHYPSSCGNFYLFLEHVFIQKKNTGRKPCLSSIIAELV